MESLVFRGIAFGGFVVTQFLQDAKGLRIGFDSFSKCGASVDYGTCLICRRNID